MIKIKNVRPGILIIADAGLKLAPGESREIENPTRQVEKAIADGLLARVDIELDTKKARTAGSKGDQKKSADSQPKTDKTQASEEGSGEQTGQAQLLETGNGAD